MKKFENKEIELKEGESNVNYVGLALICLNQVPQGGFSPKEMSGIIKVINIIEDVETGKKVELEDADFEVLKDKVNSTKWSMIHKDIVSFTECINKVK